MSCDAGSTPLRMSFWTEPTQMPSRVAAASALIVSASDRVGSKARTRRLTQDEVGADQVLGPSSNHDPHVLGKIVDPIRILFLNIIKNVRPYHRTTCRKAVRSITSHLISAPILDRRSALHKPDHGREGSGQTGHMDIL
jgi:hypothetical protein